MDYEQDEQEEQFEEQAAEPQAEDMEIDEDDAPYLEALVIPEPSIRTFLRKQVWTLTSLVFGMWLDGMVLCP